jgi:hypothetical protein
MKNIGRIFKYNPWINDTHTKYVWSAFDGQEFWRVTVRMKEPIKDKIILRTFMSQPGVLFARDLMINIDNNIQ